MIGIFEIRQGDKVKIVEIVYGGEKSANQLAAEIFTFMVENIVELFRLPINSELGRAIRSHLEAGGCVHVLEVKSRGNPDQKAVFDIERDDNTKRIELPTTSDGATKLVTEIATLKLSQEKVQGWVN